MAPKFSSKKKAEQIKLERENLSKAIDVMRSIAPSLPPEMTSGSMSYLFTMIARGYGLEPTDILDVCMQVGGEAMNGTGRFALVGLGDISNVDPDMMKEIMGVQTRLNDLAKEKGLMPKVGPLSELGDKSFEAEEPCQCPACEMKRLMSDASIDPSKMEEVNESIAEALFDVFKGMGPTKH